MTKFPKPIQDLIDELGRLPGVGPKTAERYAFALLKSRPAERQRLATAITAPDLTLKTCSTCRNYTEEDPCRICSDSQRDGGLICVVANEPDLLAIEYTGEFRGLYHILGGVLSPADGVMPDDLNVNELTARVQDGQAREVILAFDQTIEGEATVLYLSRLLSRLGVRLTRLARGLPIGSELGYADEVTLGDALRGRREVAPEAKAAARPG